MERTYPKRIMILIIGSLLLFVLLPMLVDTILPPAEGTRVPDVTPGQRFRSEWEGLEQTVVAVTPEHVQCTVVLDPHAPGPPAHSHLTFDEHFVVQEGTLSLERDGRTQHIGPGGAVTIPRGAVHRIHNATDRRVVLVGDPQQGMYPPSFGGALAELYAFVDERPEHQHPPAILLKIAAMGDVFDSWLPGPPIPVQRVMRRVLRPYARLFGQARMRAFGVPTMMGS
jgi:mannose-6-phosphate isomerase-like protein (cupin superfamily)